jgi:hypothetical protein
MEHSRSLLRRVVLFCLVAFSIIATPYALIGWKHMAIGDGMLLDYQVSTTTDPPGTVVVSVTDANGRPVPAGSIRLYNSSGGGRAALDQNGMGRETMGEPVVDDIEFLPCDTQGVGRARMPAWTWFFRHGAFSVREHGVRLDIRLRWSQVWK